VLQSVTPDRAPMLVRTQRELERLAEVFGRCDQCGMSLDMLQLYPPGQPVNATRYCTACSEERPLNGQ
jgi:hypothetical protein